MKGVKVGPARGTARVAAGVLAEELGAATQEQGMSSPPGSSPNVGTIGNTLGGGLGWLGRRHGFACNRVRAIELATADGEQRRVDADSDPDLVWARGGGGGGYAIVTELEVDLLPISEAYAGAIFPAELGVEGGPRLPRLDWSVEGGYFNFAKRPCGVDTLLPAETCERLAEVKGRWDPDDVILANHAVSLTHA